MKDVKEFNISLSHSNIHLDLNNPKDVDNIQYVLTILKDANGDKAKTIEILSNTSMKYLKRLQGDGIISDKGGPNIVPVFAPYLTDNGIDFFNAGGYKKLFDLNNSNNLEKNNISITADNVHIGDNFGTYSQQIDSRTKNTVNHNTLTPQGNKQSTIIEFIFKYWWAFLLPVMIGIILLLIEYNFFN